MPDEEVNSEDLNCDVDECLDVYKQKIFHMHEQNTQLAAMVANYKKIVVDTVSIHSYFIWYKINI